MFDKWLFIQLVKAIRNGDIDGKVVLKGDDVREALSGSDGFSDDVSDRTRTVFSGPPIEANDVIKLSKDLDECSSLEELIGS